MSSAPLVPWIVTRCFAYVIGLTDIICRPSNASTTGAIARRIGAGTDCDCGSDSGERRGMVEPPRLRMSTPVAKKRLPPGLAGLAHRMGRSGFCDPYDTETPEHPSIL